MVAQQLTKQLRDHVDARGSMFSDDGSRGSLSLGSREERPILCIFERNFDLAAALQHAWTYAPLVHDVLDMRLNRVDITQGSSALDAAAGKKFHDLEDNDPFWRANADSQFPKVAEEVEAQLAAYKKAIAEAPTRRRRSVTRPPTRTWRRTRRSWSAPSQACPSCRSARSSSTSTPTSPPLSWATSRTAAWTSTSRSRRTCWRVRGTRPRSWGCCRRRAGAPPRTSFCLAIIYAMTHPPGTTPCHPRMPRR